jgi:hypothetical protein
MVRRNDRRGAGRATLQLGAVFAAVVAGPAFGVEWRPMAPGEAYRVTTQSAFSGWSAPPAGEAGKKNPRVEFTGSSKIVFRERALQAPSGGRLRFFRIYEASEYVRKTGGGEERGGLRPQVKRILLDPDKDGHVIYSPDDRLQFSELAMIDEHVRRPGLEAFLTTGELTPGRTWKAPPAAIIELTGVDEVVSGEVVCKVEKIMEIGSRRLLQISANGAVAARAGPARARCEIRGGLYVEPATGRFVSLRTIGKQETFGPDDQIVASLDVDYQVLVEPLADDPDLSDDAVASLPAAPSPEMLMIAFESAAHGVQFEHARRWSVQRIDPHQILLAAPDGAFVVSTSKESKTPATSEYFETVEKHLKDRNVQATLVRAARESTSEAGRIGAFRFEATLDGRPSVLDYWVVERKGRGATVAVNAARSAAPELLPEVERIVRTMRFSPR